MGGRPDASLVDKRGTFSNEMPFYSPRIQKSYIGAPRHFVEEVGIPHTRQAGKAV